MVESRSVRLRNGILAAIALGLLTAFAVIPIGWALLTAFKPLDQIVSAKVIYIPNALTLDNFAAVLEHQEFIPLFRNSLIVCLMTVIICLSIGSIAGYGLSRHHGRGRLLLLVFYLSIRMFPAILILIPLIIIQRDFGLLNTHIGLALAYTTFLLPLVVWMMKNYFDAIPVELEDAARIDGCGRITTFARITAPLARQGLAATAMLIAIGSWNEFLFALFMTTGTGTRTWPVGIQLLIGQFNVPWGQLAAAGVIAILPVMLAFLIAGRTLIRGLVAGGVRG
jgi:multiple sugar transport system permease protein